MGDTMKFEPNVPVEVALVYGKGKVVEAAFGRRVMFTLVGGKTMFLDVGTADKIERLSVKPRQPFFVCKYQEKRGELDRWRVWLPGQESGEQPDGAFSVPALPPVQTRAPLPNGQAQFLLSQVTDLIDVYAAALHYSQDRHGDKVGAGVVEALLLAAIQQRGSHAR